MFRSLCFVLMVLVALTIAGCVVPEDGGSGTGTTATSTGSSAGRPSGDMAAVEIMRVNGEPVTIGELLNHPPLRQTLFNEAFIVAMMQEAEKANLKVDTSEIDEQIQQQREMVSMQNGMSWNDFLAMQGVSEEDIRSQMETQMYIQEYIESLVTIDEQELKTVFESNRSGFIEQYARENMLLDTEKAEVEEQGLAHEGFHEFLMENQKNTKAQSVRDEKFQEIVDTMEISLTIVSDKEAAKYYEDLIVNFQKTAYRDAIQTRMEQGTAIPEASEDESVDTAEMSAGDPETAEDEAVEEEKSESANDGGASSEAGSFSEAAQKGM